MVKAVVVGGGAAGMSAASRIRRMYSDIEIIVLEKTGFVSYSQCGIPYYVEGLVNEPNELIAHTPEFFKKERNISVFTHAHVEEVDLRSKTLTYAKNGTRESMEWDKLVIASGAEPVKPRINGSELENILTVKFMEDGVRVKNAAAKANNVVIVGGGYIGVEMSEAFTKIGKKVTIVEMLPHTLSNFDPEISEIVEHKLTENSVNLRLGEKVVEFVGKESVRMGARATGLKSLTNAF